MQKLSQKTQGIVYVLIAAFGFSLMSMFIKLAGDLPSFEKAFFRNFVALIFITILMLRSRTSFRPERRNLPALFGRCFFGTLGLLCNFYAIGKLNLPERPKDVPTKQASAAVGQCELMYTYDKLFTEYNHTVAQLLITRPDIAGGGRRRENFHVTLERLLELGALPIINENDTISTEEISIGDNDTLSAMVAASIRADLLILLSDIDGLYDSDPHENPDARLIPVVERLDDHIRALAGGSGSSLGTGGMVTKLQAAQIATEAGCEMVIANGHHPAALYDIAAGQPAGTRFLAGRKEL